MSHYPVFILLAAAIVCPLLAIIAELGEIADELRELNERRNDK